MYGGQGRQKGITREEEKEGERLGKSAENGWGGEGKTRDEEDHKRKVLERE